MVPLDPGTRPGQWGRGHDIRRLCLSAAVGVAVPALAASCQGLPGEEPAQSGGPAPPRGETVQVDARWLTSTEAHAPFEVTWQGAPPQRVPIIEAFAFDPKGMPGWKGLGLVMLPERVELVEQEEGRMRWVAYFPRLEPGAFRRLHVRVVNLEPPVLGEERYEIAPDR